jgi:enoyl-CoA hydratase
MKFDQYQHLLFERHEDGVLLITINRPEVRNATNARLHWELGQVWKDVGEDDQTRVAVITGAAAGNAFCAGGDNSLIESTAGDYAKIAKMWQEANDIVYNMLNLDKPIISAINGPALGGGLAVALMADIPVAAESARIIDPHVRLGVATGDHAVIIWPLLCGMAKAKYYLLTAEGMDGKEAERIGLVSLCVPAEQLIGRAMGIARQLGRGPQQALRWTKRSLNNWLKMAAPAFDTSLALEMLGFFSDDLREGIRAIIEKRGADFPSARPVR